MEGDSGLKRNPTKAALLRLADCCWIKEHLSPVSNGSGGSGKSFLASALGQQPCISGHRVLYRSGSKLFGHLKLSRADASYPRWPSAPGRPSLIVGMRSRSPYRFGAQEPL